MSNKNWYILLMTSFILIAIIGYYHIILTGEVPIVEPRELDVEIQANDYVHVLGEDIEISVYLYNDRLTPVRIEKEELSIGVSVWIHAPLSNDSMIHYIRGSSAIVPARSRILWGKTILEAKTTGIYTIDCLGEKVTVKVVFQDEDATF